MYVTQSFINKLPSFSGAYDKPSLSSMTGIMAPSGENVKLRCFSTLKFDASILMKKDGVHTIQNQISTSEGGGHQAVFLLNHVSSTQTGTYRCYGVFGHYPYVWSHPSDRLQLWVTGEEAPAHQSSCPILEMGSVQVEQGLEKGGQHGGKTMSPPSS